MTKTINVHLDWLSATTSMEPGLIAGRLRAVGASDVHVATPHTRGYPAACDVLNGDGDAICRIEYGASHRRNLVDASGSQPNAHIRQVMSTVDDCLATRVDSAIDVEGDWDYYADLAQKLAETPRKGCPAVKTIDRIKSPTGRTLYLGSRHSAIVVRVYEKSREQWSKGNSNFPAGIIRLELQWRPKDSNRRVAMTVSPSQMWGASPWTTDIAHRILDDVHVIDRPVAEATTWDRRYNWMTTQAGSIFRQAVSRYGLLAVLDDMGIDDVQGAAIAAAPTTAPAVPRT
jgi:hypothetical protein